MGRKCSWEKPCRNGRVYAKMKVLGRCRLGGGRGIKKESYFAKGKIALLNNSIIILHYLISHQSFPLIQEYHSLQSARSLLHLFQNIHVQEYV